MEAAGQPRTPGKSRPFVACLLAACLPAACLLAACLPAACLPALDVAQLDAGAAPDTEAVEAAASKHVLAGATVVAKYERR